MRRQRTIRREGRATSAMCAMGRNEMCTSSFFKTDSEPIPNLIPAAKEMMLRWLMQTPLGSPVVPDVYLV